MTKPLPHRSVSVGFADVAGCEYEPQIGLVWTNGAMADLMSRWLLGLRIYNQGPSFLFWSRGRIEPRLTRWFRLPDSQNLLRLDLRGPLQAPSAPFWRPDSVPSCLGIPSRGRKIL